LVFIELIHYLLEERAHIAFFFAFQNVGFLNIDAFQESAMQCERIRTVLTLPGDSAPDLSIFGLALRKECLNNSDSTLVIDPVVFA
jgi:hypothetical protein